MSVGVADVWVGIATGYERGAQRIRPHYAESVERAGGIPVLLPIAASSEVVAALSDRLDALVIPGGPGITRGLEGELPPELGPTPPERARFDEAIAGAFLEREKPILGICYGMQLLNVLGGGTVHGDVERALPGSLAHSPKRGAKEHPIRIERGSALHEALGREEAIVNSRHLQAVSVVAAGYRVTARAPDGVVEAIESENGRVVGVQFHPELMGEEMDAIFERLLVVV